VCGASALVLQLPAIFSAIRSPAACGSAAMETKWPPRHEPEVRRADARRMRSFSCHRVGARYRRRGSGGARASPSLPPLRRPVSCAVSHGRMGADVTDRERKAAAMRLALQLPAGREDALRVLDMLNALVHAFLIEPIVDPEPQLQPPRVRRVDFGAG
jgi:hypothetical protein